MSELPAPVADLCVMLAAISGVEAVAMGGSRATGVADAESDWDIGLYYRGHPDLSPLASLGELHPPGSWGRVMNGGAWLRLDGLKVDVLLRDLDVVEHWSARARDGLYEVDALLGYVAGVPTYSLTAEVAVNRVVVGALPRIADYPQALARTGASRWRRHAEFSLVHARMRAARGDVVGTVGTGREGGDGDGPRGGLPAPGVGAEREAPRRASRPSRAARAVHPRASGRARAGRLGGCPARAD